MGKPGCNKAPGFRTGKVRCLEMWPLEIHAPGTAAHSPRVTCSLDGLSTLTYPFLGKQMKKRITFPLSTVSQEIIVYVKGGLEFLMGVNNMLNHRVNRPVLPSTVALSLMPAQRLSVLSSVFLRWEVGWGWETLTSSLLHHMYEMLCLFAKRFCFYSICFSFSKVKNKFHEIY